MAGIMHHISRKRNLFALLTHIAAGMLVFYFLLHPLAMAVNAGNGLRDTMNDMWERLLFQLTHAFSIHMLPMAYLFIVAGAIMGLLSGLFWLSLMRKKATAKEEEAPDSIDAERLIAAGENHYAEFKSSIRYDFRQKTTNRDLEEVIAKTIAGFMNAEGGYLLIGVKDSGEVVGLEKDFMTLRQKNEDGFERRIFDLVTTSLGAEYCHLCNASFHKLDGQTICVVKIEASAEPVYLSGADTTAFYIRAGNATRQLSVKETVKYLKMKGTKSAIIN